MVVWDLINKYLIAPIYEGTGYNPINTAVLAILFVFMVESTQRTLKWLKIDMNRFSKVFVPYVFLGGVIRSLTDAAIYPHTPLLVTPGIYLLMLSLSFLDAIFKLPIGWVLLALNLTFITVKNNSYLLIFAFGAMATGISILLLKLLRYKLDIWPVLAIGAHMLDAASTFVAIDFLKYGEQHVLANFFIGLFHTAAVMFLLKFAALLLVLKAFEDIKDPEMRTFFYLVVIAVGAGPGIRNTLSASMNV